MSLDWTIVPSTARFSGPLLRGCLNPFFLSAGITRFMEASSSKYIRFDYVGVSSSGSYLRDTSTSLENPKLIFNYHDTLYGCCTRPRFALTLSCAPMKNIVIGSIGPSFKDMQKQLMARMF